MFVKIIQFKIQKTVLNMCCPIKYVFFSKRNRYMSRTITPINNIMSIEQQRAAKTSCLASYTTPADDKYLYRLLAHAHSYSC